MIFNDYSDSEASMTSTASNSRNFRDSVESSLASSLSEINLDQLVTPNAAMSPDYVRLDQFKWQYRGEGGANLVISLEVSWRSLKFQFLPAIQKLVVRMG